MSRMKCRVYISLSRYGASLPTGCESASSRDEVMSALFSLSPDVALATVPRLMCGALSPVYDFCCDADAHAELYLVRRFDCTVGIHFL